MTATAFHTSTSRLAQFRSWLLAAIFLGMGGVAHAQDPSSLGPEEIEALLAPIALYPDSLLSQVLMASTYPLEVVEADRWVKANPNLKGDAAVKAVGDKGWDVSVMSLVAFPQILGPMSEKLDWTQRLGDAFLAQQADVMNAVQRLRQKAQQAGNLESSEQQKVVVQQASPEQSVIVIEPADPQVVYVPAYNPTVVYGSWGYPSYPPYYWPPSPYYYPGGAFVSGMAWGLGVAATGAMFGAFDWGHNDIDIDVNRAVNIDNSFNRNNVNRANISGNRTSWKHDTTHRKGVSYGQQANRNKYGKSFAGADGRRDYRGHDAGAANRTRASDRGSVADRSRTSQRTGTGDRSRTASSNLAGDRAQASKRTGTSDRGGATSRSKRSSDNAFQGVGGGSRSQREASRGRSSSQSMSRSGGSRGGGGRRR
jgi:hypothetical protein